VTRRVAIGEGAAVVATFVRYRGALLPAIRRELVGWRQAATLIPDRNLREQALDSLTQKAVNAEATGVLAALAPRRGRGAVIRASTALQVAVDYLDNLGEQPGPDPLRDGLRLHGALVTALEPGAAASDWYEHHPRHEDGGYLERLVSACREAAVALPSAAEVLPVARRAMTRCGEGQSHTHAAAGGSTGRFEEWALGLPAPPGYQWWEVAAGASSSVAAHALLALAADPGASREQAEMVDRAYFPSIGALTVLLDDLVDREADSSAGQHNYLRHYSTDAVAAKRLEAIVEDARCSVACLPRANLHRAILAGVLAFYLSSADATGSSAETIRARLLASSGLVVRALTRALA
jgi:tetraprenyl-beta-curcumene synthase